MNLGDDLLKSINEIENQISDMEYELDRRKKHYLRVRGWAVSYVKGTYDEMARWDKSGFVLFDIDEAMEVEASL